MEMETLFAWTLEYSVEDKMGDSTRSVVLLVALPKALLSWLLYQVGDRLASGYLYPESGIGVK